MRLSVIQNLLARQWQRIALYTALFAGLGGLLFFKLSTLPGGYSMAELLTIQQAGNWRVIFDNPLNAPFLAVIHPLLAHENPLLISRIAAAACGLLALVFFYILVRHWHGERVAVFGTVLFGASGWFLHIARFGTPEVLLFGLLALLACYLWLRQTSSGWALLAIFVLIALLLYTPGMIWFVLMGVIAQWKAVDRYFKRNLWAVTVGGVLLLVALIPLGFAVYHHPEVAKIYAGLPPEGWPMPLTVLRNMADIPLHLFIQGPSDPQRWLGTLPLLDFFTIAMFFLGGYLYIRHAKLGRFWLLVGILLVGTVLASLGGGVTLTLLVPFIYIIAAAGIGFMLDRWMAVFPRNVIARGVGYGMLCVAVLAACFYSFRHYFIAWPQAAATKTVYTVRPSIKPSDTINR
jgi:hypothetical protein